MLPYNEARSFNAAQRCPRTGGYDPMIIELLSSERLGTSMTTVLTKSFPEENQALTETALARKRVVIIGGGFAGIAAARALKRANVEITLIDRRNHHIF